MCGDDENSFPTDGAVLIVLSVSIILLILVIPIVIVTIICLVHRKKREKPCQVQLDHEEHIYDMPHILLDTSNSATGSDDMKHVKSNVAYGEVNILRTGSDDVNYVNSNAAYGITMHRHAI